MNIHKLCVKVVEEKCVGTFRNKKDKNRNRMSGIMENIIGKNRKQVEQSKECNLQIDPGLSYLYGASSASQINEGEKTTILSQSDQSLNQSEGGNDDSKTLYNNSGLGIQEGVSDDSKIYINKDSDIQEEVRDDSKQLYNNSGSSIQGPKEKSELIFTGRSESFRLRREYKTPLRKGSDSNIPRSQSDAEVDDKTIASLNKTGGSSVSSLSTSLDSSSNSLEVMQNTTEGTPVNSGSGSSLSTGRLQSTFSSSSSSLSHLLQFDDSDLEAENEPPKWQENVNSNVIRNLKPKEKKRQDVINELFHTERTHVRNLKVLDRLFFKPLQQEKLLQQDLLDLLFPNLEELLKIHSRFNSIMKTKRREQPVIQDIGDIMLQMLDGSSGEELKSGAAVFCHNQSVALKLLKSKQKKDQKLAQFLSDTEANPLCRRLQLKDIIATGFQRLTKYPLLLENVAKYTSQKSEEHGKLLRAVDCSKQILAHVNQAVKEAENEHRLSELQKKIDRTAFEKVEASIVHSYRHLDLTKHKLIQEGPLIWRLHKQKTIEMHVVLLEEILLLLQKQDDKLQLKFHNNNLTSGREDTKVTHSPVLRVQNLFTRNVATDSKAFFIVSTSEQHAIYEFVASSTSERKKWLRCIAEAVEAQKAKSKDGSSGRDEYLQKNKLMSVSLESSHSTSSIGVESTETEEPSDDLSLDAFPLSETEISSLNHSTADDHAHSLSSQSKDTCSSCSSFEKIELFNVSTESQLINPLEIEVSKGPVVQTAESVVTPVELVTCKDEETTNDSREEEDLVSHIFQVPIEEMEHAAETVKEFEGEKRMKDLILASIYQANQLTALVREVLRVSDDESVYSKEESVVAHLETSSAAVARKSIVPSERLMNISNALNKNLTQLLSFVTEKEEQMQLQEKHGSSREQLQFFHETHQLCCNTISLSTNNLIASQSRPNSYISVTSSLSDDLSDLLNHSDEKPDAIKEVNTNDVHDIEEDYHKEESEDKDTEKIELGQEWKDREKNIVNTTESDVEGNIEECCVHNTERDYIKNDTDNVKEKELWGKKVKENYKNWEEHKSNLENLNEEEEENKHNKREMNVNFGKKLDHMSEDNKQGNKNFEKRFDNMNEDGEEEEDKELNENFKKGLDSMNEEEQDNKELNENTEKELDKMNEEEQDKGSSENFEKSFHNMNEDGEGEQNNKWLNENLRIGLDNINKVEEQDNKELIGNFKKGLESMNEEEQDNKELNENTEKELDKMNEEQDNKELNENTEKELDKMNEEQGNKALNENCEKELDKMNEEKQDNKELNENFEKELDKMNEEEQGNKELNDNIKKGLDSNDKIEQDCKELNENLEKGLAMSKKEQDNKEFNENFEKELDKMNEEHGNKALNENCEEELDKMTEEKQDNKELNENFEKELDKMKEEEQNNKELNDNIEKGLDSNDKKEQDCKELNGNLEKGLAMSKKEQDNKELNENFGKELDKMNEEQGKKALNEKCEKELDKINEEEQGNKELNQNFEKELDKMNKEQNNKELNKDTEKELDKVNKEEQGNIELNDNVKKGLDEINEEGQGCKELNKIKKGLDSMDKELNENLEKGLDKKKIEVQDTKELNVNCEKIYDSTNEEEQNNKELNEKGLDKMNKGIWCKELNDNLEKGFDKMNTEEQDNKQLSENSENGLESMNDLEKVLDSTSEEERDNQKLNKIFENGLKSMNKEECYIKELNENFEKGSDNMNKQEQDNQELNENFEKVLDSMDKEKHDNEELNENFENGLISINKEQQDNKELDENLGGEFDKMNSEEQDDKTSNENFIKELGSVYKEEQKSKELNEKLGIVLDNMDKEEQNKLNEILEKGLNKMKKEEQDNKELNQSFEKGLYNMNEDEKEDKELEEIFGKELENMNKNEMEGSDEAEFKSMEEKEDKKELKCETGWENLDGKENNEETLNKNLKEKMKKMEGEEKHNWEELINVEEHLLLEKELKHDSENKLGIQLNKKERKNEAKLKESSEEILKNLTDENILDEKEKGLKMEEDKLDKKEFEKSGDTKVENLTKEEKLEKKELKENSEEGLKKQTDNEQFHKELVENFEKEIEHMKEEERYKKILKENCKKGKEISNEVEKLDENGQVYLSEEVILSEKRIGNLLGEEKFNKELMKNYEKGLENLTEELILVKNGLGDLSEEEKMDRELNKNCKETLDHLSEELKLDKELSENCEKKLENFNEGEQIIIKSQEVLGNSGILREQEDQKHSHEVGKRDNVEESKFNDVEEERKNKEICQEESDERSEQGEIPSNVKLKNSDHCCYEERCGEYEQLVDRNYQDRSEQFSDSTYEDQNVEHVYFKQTIKSACREENIMDEDYQRPTNDKDQSHQKISAEIMSLNISAKNIASDNQNMPEPNVNLDVNEVVQLST
ncbi:putative leucine-rich repeat-containing protein DDB_G0290503 isoform X2 [Limulus polyphemus]|uniref:Leucine-rich repeat-containing protein DDB_G0290503 isoform X2 n=1 Tax=Limulus polyphemus TaxID=6850 RepID=A0ABM1TRE5_LIMPO|nr:putative leucine-rich repeat-containing protein DDB_G0290503 isoform X2 [Limulus polyphemus]